MLKVGIAKADITPPLGSQLAGYGDAHRPAEEVHDPLYATAIVFEQDNVQACRVTLDLTQVENGDIARMQQLAAEKSGIPAAHINIGVTHTHSAPQSHSFDGWGTKDDEYLATLIPKVAQAVRDASDKLIAVKLGITTTETKVGINRRSVQKDHNYGFRASLWDDNPYDSTMTVIRFEGDNGPVATLIHASAHGTAMGINRIISRDWPGVMIDRVESQTKAPAIFINGSFGDTGPRTNMVLEPGTFSAGGGDGIHSVYEVGYRGASDAIWAHQSIKNFTDNVKLKVLVEEIKFPVAPLPPLEKAQRQLKECEPHKDESGGGKCNYRYWQRVIEAHSKPPITHYPFRQTIISLGPIAFVPLPGEPFTSINLRLRKYSPFQYTLACGGTNGMYCYLPDREARHRGGYETWVSIGTLTYLLADNIDDVLVEENVKLLENIYSD